MENINKKLGDFQNLLWASTPFRWKQLSKDSLDFAFTFHNHVQVYLDGSAIGEWAYWKISMKH